MLSCAPRTLADLNQRRSKLASCYRLIY